MCTYLFPFIASLSDTALSASSEYGSARSVAQSRLHEESGGGSWQARPSGPGQWIAADLGAERTIQRVATQGRHNVDRWVTSYKFSYSLYRTSWSYVLDESGNERVFTANSDSGTVVENDFEPVLARYVRLEPISWNLAICLRWEVYGCMHSGPYICMLYANLTVPPLLKLCKESFYVALLTTSKDYYNE